MKPKHIVLSFFKMISICLVIACLTMSACSGSDDDDDSTGGATFKVVGRDLIDPCGEKVLLKGVNKMSIFDQEDIYGQNYFPEIAKTNANCVRIVWFATHSSTQQLAQFDSLIKNCIKHKMIPMIELHDATCNWDLLDDVVAFWVKPEVVQLIQKYQHTLLVNIANEAGAQDKVTEAQFLAGYKDAITKMRNAGIKTPLVIDGPDCGKNLDIVVQTSAELIQHDPDHNVMFSVHTYWSNLAIQTFAGPTFIKDQLQKAVDNNVPLILGELCAVGGWPGSDDDQTLICTPLGAVDYKTLLAEASTRNIGWLLWEWGPGNGFYGDRDGDGLDDPTVLCPQMDLTTDRTYNSIVAITAASPNAWAKDAVITGTYSLKNTATKSAYITNGFKCQ
jgi:mannan endo-1,4-beta-mannosidase